MSQHTKEQATQFNFIDQAALGMHYFFRKNTAFTLEGRLRHLSGLIIFMAIFYRRYKWADPYAGDNENKISCLYIRG